MMNDLVASTAEAQAEMVPSAVTNIKLGTLPCTRKPPVELFTPPVTTPLAELAPGTAGLVVALGAPLLVYTVDKPVPASLTQNGLAPEV